MDARRLANDALQSTAQPQGGFASTELGRSLPKAHMNNSMKFDSTATTLELIPAVVQINGIATFVLVTWGEIFQSFVAVMLGLIWLKVSNSNKLSEDLANFRLRRLLFSRLGEWMNQDDAASEFDYALARYQLIEDVESDKHTALVTATAIANGIRSLVTFLLSCYLIYLIITYAST